MSGFTWIPFYKELAEKLLEYKDRRDELVKFVYSSLDKTDYLSMEDGKTPIKDIDPFTFFGIFNRRTSKENRVKNLMEIKKFFNINAPVPTDFDGIPILNNLNSYYYDWSDKKSFDELWDIFIKFINNGMDQILFTKLFNKKNIGYAKATMPLFWIKPEQYMPMDNNSKDYLIKQRIINRNEIKPDNYLSLLDIIKGKLNSNAIVEKSFVEISENAWLNMKNNKINYWAVGYAWESTGDQRERFFNDGIWEEGYLSHGDTRFKADLDEVAIGDILLLKSSATKGKGHSTSFTKLVAVGEVLDKISESVFSIEWLTPNTLPREFDGISYRKTIEKMRNDEMKKFAERIINNKGETMKNKLENNGKYAEYVNLLKNTHNLILHGAPGTGKTYLAKKIAEEMQAEVGFVQFHPSYDYTDFVEGLRPVKDNGNGQIGFERKDGVFKKFCEKALKNFQDSKKSTVEIEKEASIDEKLTSFIADAIENNREFEIVTGNKFFITDMTDKSILISIPANEKTNELSLPLNELKTLLSAEESIENGNDIRAFFNRKWRTQQDSYNLILYKKIKDIKTPNKSSEVSRTELKSFVFIIDEINRGDMSKIFGELFFAIEPSYRGAEKCKNMRTQYANLQTEPNEFDKVLKITDIDNFGHFFIPENVYIIGTMNDIDRGVESMDFAFRRRFTFVEVKASDRIEMLDKLDDIIREEAISKMNSLNNAIWDDKNKTGTDGLSSAYHIGGAYFLKLERLGGDFNLLWEYHLSPLLHEYLRGMEDEKEKFDALKKAYDNPHVKSEEKDKQLENK